MDNFATQLVTSMLNIWNAPRLLPALAIGNDPRLLAGIASVIAQSGAYVPLVDGPRVLRTDVSAEFNRRHNLAARIQPSAIFLAGLDQDTQNQLARHLPRSSCFVVNDASDVRQCAHGMPTRPRKKLTWGSDYIGLGLLEALRSKKQIEFTDFRSPKPTYTQTSRHLVACECWDEFAQVLAANYAYSIGADLVLMPEIENDESEDILNRFYSVYEDKESTASDTFSFLRNELRTRSQIPEGQYSCITFFTKEIPWGFGFPEQPTTHIFRYPDLGISIANGIAAEQPRAPGIRVAAVVDPFEVNAPEVTFVAEALAENGSLVRGYRGIAANVRNVGHMAELLPYDFLFIATHCGDADGWRCTYEYQDSEGIQRTLVVDVAIGVGHDPRSEKIPITQFIKFVSLDGVDWNDRSAKKDLYVGSAINDYVNRDKDGGSFKPSKRERIGRVRWSSALKMHDHNFILLPISLAGNGTPVVINNACASWHRLASTFIFGGARAYIGTLFSVSDLEAEEVVKNLLRNQFGKPLSLGIWSAQKDIYGEDPRRPYVMVGPHFQTLKQSSGNNAKYLVERLKKALTAFNRKFQNGKSDEDDARHSFVEGRRDFLLYELEGLRSYLEVSDPA